MKGCQIKTVYLRHFHQIQSYRLFLVRLPLSIQQLLQSLPGRTIMEFGSFVSRNPHKQAQKREQTGTNPIRFQTQ